ncbi:MAG: SNUT3/LISCH7 family protein, partial [Deltaproteobacteria bacterium]|nr:SNUT3/LISCH7 family protein [Deltaproteobacteria bacterium]
RRVEVATDIGDADPEAALAQVLSSLSGGTATYDPDTGELVPSVRLTLSVIEEGGKPCSVQAEGGYLGHENQAIRIDIRGPRSFSWGFCNAAPLYRVRSVGGSTTRFRLITQPRDQSLHLRERQIVEILPLSARLENGETVAELQGQLARVTKPYNPATQEIELELPIPYAWINLANQELDEVNLTGVAGGEAHLYMRVWDRGSDTTSEPEIPFIEGKPVPLGNTGLQATFSGPARTGAYWVAAARKQAPKQIWPWELLTNAAPLGTRHFFAPLALVSWQPWLVVPPYPFFDFEGAAFTSGSGGVFSPQPLSALYGSLEFEAQSLDGTPLFYNQASGDIHVNPSPNTITTTGIPGVELQLRLRIQDVRRRLRPLCERGCCTVLVGDGDTSSGQVNTLEEALALLPAVGGRICLLPGRHVAEVEISGRSNLTISGCGAQSVLVNETPLVAPGPLLSTQGPTLLTFSECHDIVIENLTIETFASIGIEFAYSDPGCKRIRIERVRFDVRGSFGTVVEFPGYGAPPQAAVLALAVDGFEIVDCRVDVQDLPNHDPALVIGGNQLRIHRNWIQAGEFEAAGIARAMGGDSRAQPLDRCRGARQHDPRRLGAWNRLGPRARDRSPDRGCHRDHGEPGLDASRARPRRGADRGAPVGAGRRHGQWLTADRRVLGAGRSARRAAHHRQSHPSHGPVRDLDGVVLRRRGRRRPALHRPRRHRDPRERDPRECSGGPQFEPLQ